jgi:23S rRNA (adenine2503-C2)-methyltransferase
MMAFQVDVTGLTRAEAEALAESLGQPRYRGRQLFRWVQARRVRDLAAMTDLSRPFREVLQPRIRIGRPATERVQQAGDGTRKFLLRLDDGEQIESVLIPDAHRLTACISTQAGCPLACRFCLTGLMGIRRNLRAAEIVGQVLALQDAAEARITNLVLMGMGEPLLNFAEVERAIRILLDGLGADFSPRRITLSTAGHVPGIRKLAESDLGVNLAVSLSATTDAVRDQLMPINRRWPIAALLRACRDYPLPNRRRLTFEYVMLDNVNDTDADAIRLARLLRGIRCKVNLIPFNATPALPDRPSPRPRIEAFRQMLHDASLTATVRESRGSDIAAACGMLRTEAGTAQTV